MSGKRKRERAAVKVCPECGKEIDLRRLPMPKYGKRAIFLFAMAGVVSLLWAGGLFLWSPVLLKPRTGHGFLECAAVYLAPGIGLGIYASSLPKVRTFSCRHCDWSESVPQ